jgi:peroxiredoxin Q/BCP
MDEGDIPYSFDYSDSNGNTHNLSEILGIKDIVIYFYPKDFTPGCTIEAEEFTKDYTSFKEKGIEIIGVSPDPEDSHQQFRLKKNIPYMLASDIENTISKQYGVYGLKKFMGKEYYGVNRATFLIGRDGKIIKVFSNVKPRGHSEEIMAYFRNRKSNANPI